MYWVLAPKEGKIDSLWVWVESQEYKVGNLGIEKERWRQYKILAGSEVNFWHQGTKEKVLSLSKRYKQTFGWLLTLSIPPFPFLGLFLCLENSRDKVKWTESGKCQKVFHVDIWCWCFVTFEMDASCKVMFKASLDIIAVLIKFCSSHCYHLLRSL